MRASEVGPVIQEDFDPVGEGTLEGLDARIRDCAAVVHLIGDMAGAFPPPSAVRCLLDRHPNLAVVVDIDGLPSGLRNNPLTWDGPRRCSCSQDSVSLQSLPVARK
jgi:hypothetical protein